MSESDHANVMGVTDFGEDEDYMFLVMELMVDDMRNAIHSTFGRFNE